MSTYVCLFTDSEHFHRKWIRASEKMDVNESVGILKEYMKQLLGTPIDLGGDVLPLKKLEREGRKQSPLDRGRMGTASCHI